MSGAVPALGVGMGLAFLAAVVFVVLWYRERKTRIATEQRCHDLEGGLSVDAARGSKQGGNAAADNVEGGATSQAPRSRAGSAAAATAKSRGSKHGADEPDPRMATFFAPPEKQIRTLAAGDDVTLQGLQDRKDLNGHPAIVLRAPSVLGADAIATVRLRGADGLGETMRLPRRNLKRGAGKDAGSAAPSLDATRHSGAAGGQNRRASHRSLKDLLGSMVRRGSANNPLDKPEMSQPKPSSIHSQKAGADHHHRAEAETAGVGGDSPQTANHHSAAPSRQNSPHSSPQTHSSRRQDCGMSPQSVPASHGGLGGAEADPLIPPPELEAGVGAVVAALAVAGRSLSPNRGVGVSSSPVSSRPRTPESGATPRRALHRTSLDDMASCTDGGGTAVPGSPHLPPDADMDKLRSILAAGGFGTLPRHGGAGGAGEGKSVVIASPPQEWSARATPSDGALPMDSILLTAKRATEQDCSPERAAERTAAHRDPRQEGGMGGGGGGGAAVPPGTLVVPHVPRRVRSPSPPGSPRRIGSPSPLVDTPASVLRPGLLLVVKEEPAP